MYFINGFVMSYKKCILLIYEFVSFYFPASNYFFAPIIYTTHRKA
jgi:hypothetical protein